MANDLTGQNIQDTYKRVLTVGDDGLMYDGTGSLYTPLSASHEITTEVSSSHAVTADSASYILASNIDQPFTNITASGDISSSATITSNETVVSGHITASGNISARGDIIADNIIGTINGGTF